MPGPISINNSDTILYLMETSLNTRFKTKARGKSIANSLDLNPLKITSYNFEQQQVITEICFTKIPKVVNKLDNWIGI